MVAIQVRDVPEDVRATLVREAERRDQSLQAYLTDVLKREADSAKNLQWLAEWTPLTRGTGTDVVQLIHEGREERDRQLMAALGRGDSDAAD